jgi:hypothetical protein
MLKVQPKLTILVKEKQLIPPLDEDLYNKDKLYTNTILISYDGSMNVRDYLPNYIGYNDIIVHHSVNHTKDYNEYVVSIPLTNKIKEGFLKETESKLERDDDIAYELGTIIRRNIITQQPKSEKEGKKQIKNECDVCKILAISVVVVIGWIILF